MNTVDSVTRAPEGPDRPVGGGSLESLRGGSDAASPRAVTAVKRRLLVVGAVVYALFVSWCLVLLALLPTISVALEPLVSVGAISAVAGFVGFGVVGGIAFQRILKADVAIATRRRSLAKLGAMLVPGILLSVITPLLIMREPPLQITITDPKSPQEFVAPLAVTFDASSAVAVLKGRGLRATGFSWDYEGDGQINDETVIPISTALYDRQGSYAVTVRIHLDDGSVRKVVRRLVIPQSVFSVIPMRPLAEKPVRFSVAHLLKDPKDLREVQWDFDGDGTMDQMGKAAEITHTFFGVGRVNVTAVVQLANQTQMVLRRVLEIREPSPLPFPVTLVTEPQNLVGPPPFGLLARIETAEPLKEVEWSFGDGTSERGADLRRVGHSYERAGYYALTANVRSEKGRLAELTTFVRVTSVLDLRDLTFDSTPKISDSSVHGEVPLTIRIIPKTTIPLITFSWEAPDAVILSATGALLHAVYRKEGTYTVRLLAQDPEGKALRLPIVVKVLPPTAEASIQARPEGGTAPLRVTFDASETFVPPGEEVAGFAWYFGDEPKGAAPELGPARIEHVYERPGEYTVRLNVVTISGREFTTTRTLVVRRPALDACITASRLNVQVGKGVEFDADCSTGSPSTVLWDIRGTDDPDTIVAQSDLGTFVHVFAEPGTYVITLTVDDAFANRDRETVTVRVTP